MKRDDAAQGHASLLFVIAPVRIVDLHIGSSVINLPIFQTLCAIIDPELLRKKAVHQSDGQGVTLCCLGRCAQEGLL